MTPGAEKEFDFGADDAWPGFDLETAARLPAQVRFGASSWKYPGWKGTVYTAEETRALCELAHAHGYRVHVDGASSTSRVTLFSPESDPVELGSIRGVIIPPSRGLPDIARRSTRSPAASTRCRHSAR